MVHFKEKARYDYDDLLEIIRVLRSPEGCPWDQVQTHQSIRRGLLEEAYEAAEGIDRDDADLLREELGDVLMQVVFHADIERQRGRFTMEDVVDGVVKKLIFRHPHVFGGAEPEKDAESVLVSWDAIKRQEKHQRTTTQAMDSVARSLPALWRAEKLQNKAADDGFDWPDIQGALSKLDEEVGELHQAVQDGANVAEELGDVLFAAVKAARFAGVDPEDEAAVTALLDGLDIELKYGADGLQHMYLDGEDVTDAIRQHVISRYTSGVSAIPAVRAFLLERQRDMAREHDVIMDGRDIGTVVLPGADVKIFLTASPEDRARRRFDELRKRGQEADYDTVLRDIILRDEHDTRRSAAPLRQAKDALLVDTTGNSLDESLDVLLETIKERLKA